MDVQRKGSETMVVVSREEVMDFKRRWPASGLPDHSIVFTFAKNGDLMDVWPNGIDGAAAVALSHDAQHFAGL